MVIVVGGPQVRVGSHRQFVQQARSAAAGGVPTLRFDLRGMGDSEGTLRNFEHLSPDIAAAIDALQLAVPAVRRVVLWGLCDGASAALLYLDDSGHDPRVQGLVLLNPWVRSDATLAATHVKHYYLQRLLQREFWAKLLRGQVSGESLQVLFRNLELAIRSKKTKRSATVAPAQPFTLRMARAWERFEGQVLVILSGKDYTAKEFVESWASSEWASARKHRRTSRVDIPDADHTFSTAGSRASAERHSMEWFSKWA